MIFVLKVLGLLLLQAARMLQLVFVLFGAIYAGTHYGQQLVS